MHKAKQGFRINTFHAKRSSNVCANPLARIVWTFTKTGKGAGALLDSELMSRVTFVRSLAYSKLVDALWSLAEKKKS